jgi:hypothetical protein
VAHHRHAARAHPSAPLLPLSHATSEPCVPPSPPHSGTVRFPYLSQRHCLNQGFPLVRELRFSPTFFQSNVLKPRARTTPVREITVATAIATPLSVRALFQPVSLQIDPLIMPPSIQSAVGASRSCRHHWMPAAASRCRCTTTPPLPSHRAAAWVSSRSRHLVGGLPNCRPCSLWQPYCATSTGEPPGGSCNTPCYGSANFPLNYFH